MPVDQELARQLLLRQPRRIGSDAQPLPQTDPTSPSSAKSAFEGGVDTLLGILGVGPETKSNLTGQLLMAGLPLKGAIKGIPGMYSKLTRAAEEMPDAMTAAAAKSYLMNRAPKEEMQYRSALTTLEGKNPTDKVRKGEILGHLEKNPLDVEVKTLGNEIKYPRIAPGAPMGQDAHTVVNDPTKYGRYTLPGGQNYRETLIKLDKPIKPTPEFPQQKRLDELDNTYNDRTSWPGMSEADYQEMNRLDAERLALHTKHEEELRKDHYWSSHWDDKDIIAHVRYNERNLGQSNSPQEVINKWAATPQENYSPEELEKFKNQLNGAGTGPKGRFLEEIQSDWHEQGRDKGYQLPPEETAKLEQEYKTGVHRLADIRAKKEELGLQFDESQFRQQYVDQIKRNQELEKILANNDRAVPNGPFKENWPDLAIKQQILDVAHKPDLEWLGWTPGEVQNKRYDLAQNVSALEYDPKSGHFWAYDPDGTANFSEEKVTPQRLVEIVGKDAAQRLITQPLSEHGLHRLSGVDLQVGGEGMNKFYDERIPNTVNKLLKPFGGKVEQATLPVGSGVARRGPDADILESIDQRHGIPPQTIQAWVARLSPEMKERIKKEGLPLLMALLAREQLSNGNSAQDQQGQSQ